MCVDINVLKERKKIFLKKCGNLNEVVLRLINAIDPFLSVPTFWKSLLLLTFEKKVDFEMEIQGSGVFSKVLAQKIFL